MVSLLTLFQEATWSLKKRCKGKNICPYNKGLRYFFVMRPLCNL